MQSRPFYRWKKQDGGLEPGEARELKQLREENAKLKKLVADLSLDKAMLSDIAKKVVKASQRREVVGYLRSHYGISERRACRVVGQPRSVQWYRARRPPQDALRRRIKELAEVRVRYGHKRIHVLLRREGWRINHKRVHRLYRELGLQLRSRRPRRHVGAAHRQPPRRPACQANEPWSMDFVADQLVDGRRLRLLTVVDVCTRECLAIEVGRTLRAADVVRVLSKIAAVSGAPQRIYCDNGSEFQSRLVDLWAYTQKVPLEFSRLGKPTDNAHIESFNGSLRDERLNVHWFMSLADTREKLDAWRIEYNESRRRKALDHRTPWEYAAEMAGEAGNFSG